MTTTTENHRYDCGYYGCDYCEDTGRFSDNPQAFDTTTRRRTRCGGCGRRMYENAPQNRDLGGDSWHRECLADATGSMKDFYLSRWADDRRRYGWDEE